MYEANQELERILLKNGFIDTTSDRNKKKGKKEFKLSKYARKVIYFDYINIKIENRYHVCDSKINLTENDLKLILLYFKLNASDIKEIFDNNIFSFIGGEKRLNSLNKELLHLQEFDVRKRRQNKIEKIIDFYNKLIIE